MLFKNTIVLLFFLISPTIFAVEKNLEKETTVFNETFSWQVMGNISALYSNSYFEGIDDGPGLAFSLLIDFYYKGFFIQSNQRRTDSVILGGELGYQLIDEPKWGVDIINKIYLPGFNPKQMIEYNNKDIPTLNGLENRNSADGLGLRYSKYLDNAILTIDFANLSPLSSANGGVIDVYYSYLHPYRNWDIYIGGGLTYFSQSVLDYYVGINSDEVNDVRPIYQPGSGYRAQVEVFAQYPLSKSWSFKGGVTQSFFSSSFKDSPIIDRQNISRLILGVVYVF